MINSLLDSIKGWRSSSFKMQCFIVRTYSPVTTFNSEFSNKIYCYNRQFNLFQIDCWWCIGVSLRDVIIYTLNSLINAKFLQIIKKIILCSTSMNEFRRLNAYWRWTCNFADYAGMMLFWSWYKYKIELVNFITFHWTCFGR